MFDFFKNKYKKIKNKDIIIKKTFIVLENIVYQQYTKNGKLHREDGPALIQHRIFPDNSIGLVNKTYYKEGKLHREDGPAYQDWFLCSNGKKIKEQRWYIDDKLHREDGPAYISYDEDGNKTLEQFYVDGIRYEREFDFLIATQLYKK